jgi:hypothetical protein
VATVEEGLQVPLLVFLPVSCILFLLVWVSFYDTRRHARSIAQPCDPFPFSGEYLLYEDFSVLDIV